MMVRANQRTEALKLRTAHNLDGVVADDVYQLLGIVECEQIVNCLMLSLVPQLICGFVRTTDLTSKVS